jgi:hypothetical protein
LILGSVQHRCGQYGSDRQTEVPSGILHKFVSYADIAKVVFAVSICIAWNLWRNTHCD